MSRLLGRFLLTTTALGALLASTIPGTAQRAAADREAYFGETHVHTSWSFDAYIFGNTVTGPADAYKYATGETIKHPLGYPIKITTPLDLVLAHALLQGRT